jgi:hypothetical protein
VQILRRIGREKRSQRCKEYLAVINGLVLRCLENGRNDISKDVI